MTKPEELCFILYAIEGLNIANRKQPVGGPVFGSLFFPKAEIHTLRPATLWNIFEYKPTSTKLHTSL